MKRKPIKNSGNLLKGDVGVNIFSSAIYVTITVLALYCVLTLVVGLSSAEVTTICFLHLVFAELFHAYNLKSQRQSVFVSNPFDNKILNLSFLASALLTIIVVVAPLGAVDTAMGLCSINWWQWLLAIGTAVLIVPYFEVVKWILRAIDRKKDQKSTNVKIRNSDDFVRKTNEKEK